MTLRTITESFPTLQHHSDKIERSLIKIIAWMLGVIIFLIATGVLGHRSYRAWQERRLVAQANALVNEGNFKRASLDARRILQINPESAEGCRIMARIGERTASRVAIDWYRRAIALAPDNADDLIALARAALRFEDKASLDYALSKLPEAARTTAPYHLLAADLAQARGDAAEAEQHLGEAARLQPEDKSVALRFATMQMASQDLALRAQGLQTLASFQNDPRWKREVTQRLLEDALRRKDFGEAVTLGRQLDALPERTLAERLLLLAALHGALDAGFTPFLRELQDASAANPEQVAQLLYWLNANQMPAAAIAWATQLPSDVFGHKGAAIALSDSYVAAGDWSGVQRLMKTSNWGSVNFLRDALAARAHRELGHAPQAQAEWQEAVKKVSADPKEALTLAEIVQKWGWRDEAIELLWVAAKDPAMGDSALQALYDYFAKTGATRDIYRVLLHRHELRPEDRNVQNNVAQLSLLLNLNAERGQKLAADLYQKEPTNPVYLSTYAFALHSAGDTKKALQVMSALSEEQLRRPEFAAYYGIFLAAAGEAARASEFLDLGENAALLSEERALVEKARRAVARR